ncbi:hypothetical protein [Paenibacillus xerothermodurans]|uniref:hypothetical protein n=1 Tax=Paenibacillus xerothermodurans TaxID=1977292 RepID=UPI001FB291BC|nr:hypothetical protein [Paenibacillus xerothermodurans]
MSEHDGFICFVKKLTLHKRFLRDLDEMLGFTGQSDIIGYYGAIKHVYDAHNEEEALLAIDPSILKPFPTLI